MIQFTFFTTQFSNEYLHLLHSSRSQRSPQFRMITGILCIQDSRSCNYCKYIVIILIVCNYLLLDLRVVTGIARGATVALPTANRHLETYAPDTGAVMSLIYFLASFSLLMSFISITFARNVRVSLALLLLFQRRNVPGPCFQVSVGGQECRSVRSEQTGEQCNNNNNNNYIHLNTMQ